MNPFTMWLLAESLGPASPTGPFEAVPGEEVFPRAPIQEGPPLTGSPGWPPFDPAYGRHPAMGEQEYHPGRVWAPDEEGEFPVSPEEHPEQGPVWGPRGQMDPGQHNIGPFLAYLLGGLLLMRLAPGLARGMSPVPAGGILGGAYPRGSIPA